MTDYIAYPKAMRKLANRLEATPEELAAWIWMGPKINGLSAYLNANELDPPPRFFYDTLCENEFDYISPLMACWFDAHDIANFKPVDRYITGTALIKRWEKLPHIQPKNFIQAKIEESRLYDHHPIYGGTQGSSPEDHFPPLESGLFQMSEIELIEKEDFGITIPLQSNERDKKLQDAANALAKQWKLDNRKKITKREIAITLAKSDEWGEMIATRIERIISREW